MKLEPVPVDFGEKGGVYHGQVANLLQGCYLVFLQIIIIIIIIVIVIVVVVIYNTSASRLLINLSH